MRRAGSLRTTGGAPLAGLASPCHPAPMADPLQPETVDEALGLRALAALLDGSLDRAAEVLAAARRGYQIAFVCRLAFVVPSAAVRLAWRLASRPWVRRPATGG